MLSMGEKSADSSSASKTPWKNTLKVQAALEHCLTKDFDRVVTLYAQGQDKSYKYFCQLAQEYGITLVFNWCAPSTSKKSCHTREYSDKVIYLILNTAKRFWLCHSTNENCTFHPGNNEDKFWRQVGGLFLIHILYGNQPAVPDNRVQIDMGIRDVAALDKFLDALKERISTTSDETMKRLYQGLQYIHTRLKVEGAYRPTVLEFELGVNFVNFKT